MNSPPKFAGKEPSGSHAGASGCRSGLARERTSEAPISRASPLLRNNHANEADCLPYRSAALPGILLALATLAPLATAHAEEALGRLFFSPERRQNLDRQRELNIPEQTSEDPTLTINGVVTRSSGKRTAWINGIPQNEREMPGGALVTPERANPGAVVVETAELAGTKARVGETLSRTTGEKNDLLDGGRIVVKRNGAR